MLGTWLENKSKIVHKFNRIHTQWRKIHLIRRRVVFVGGREEKPMESNFIYTAELSRDSWKVFSWMHDCLYIEDGAWYSLYFFTPPPSFHSIRSEISPLIYRIIKNLHRAPYTIFDINHVNKTACTTKCTHHHDEYRVWLWFHCNALLNRFHGGVQFS